MPASFPTASSPSSPAAGRPWRRYLPHAVWLALVAAVLAVQWPVFRGAWMELTGTHPEPSFAWRTDFDAALAEGARTGRPVLVNFTADWCPPCVEMKRSTWPDPTVGEAVTGGYVPVLIDVDLPASAGVAERYGVTYIPTLLVVDARGGVLKRGGPMGPEDLLAFLGAEAGAAVAGATPRG